MVSVFGDLKIAELKYKILDTLRLELFRFESPDQMLLTYQGYRLPENETVSNLLEPLAEVKATPMFIQNKRKFSPLHSFDLPSNEHSQPEPESSGSFTQPTRYPAPLLPSQPLTSILSQSNAC